MSKDCEDGNGRRHEDQLADSICILAREVSTLCQQRAVEFEWVKGTFGLATKQDLKEMEQRLAKVFTNPKPDLSPAGEAALKEVQAATVRVGESGQRVNAEIEKLNEVKPQ